MTEDHFIPPRGFVTEEATHADLSEACTRHTAAALRESEAATPEEIEAAEILCNQAHHSGRSQDLIELIAIARAGAGADVEQVAAIVLEIAEAAASTLATPPALVPFAAKLITPSAFYAGFDDIRRAAQHLRCPILFAEDTDAIGTGSINPVTATIMADFIDKSVLSKSGIKPFVTAARMDHPGWTALNRKHFES